MQLHFLAYVEHYYFAFPFHHVYYSHFYQDRYIKIVISSMSTLQFTSHAFENELWFELLWLQWFLEVYQTPAIPGIEPFIFILTSNAVIWLFLSNILEWASICKYTML